MINPTKIILTEDAIRKAIFNAVKLKTNFNLIAKTEEEEKNLKTGGVYSKSIWLEENDDAIINENHNQYVIGKIYDFTRNIDQNVSLENSIDNIQIKAYNKIPSGENITEQIDADPDIKLPNTTLLKIPMLDAKFTLIKLLHNDILINNILNQIDKINYEHEIQDLKTQELLLASIDIVEKIGTDESKCLSNHYTKSDESTYLIYNLLNDNKFSISNYEPENGDYSFPNKIYVRNGIYEIYINSESGKVKNVGDDEETIDYNVVIIPKYQYVEYSLLV